MVGLVQQLQDAEAQAGSATAPNQQFGAKSGGVDTVQC